VDANAFAIACKAIDRMEREHLQFVDSAARLWEKYEGSRKFLANQRKKIEAAH
jgi:hypothetical protein